VIRITADEWVEKYKPIKNPTNDWGGDYSAFETFTPDVTFVLEQPEKFIWTEMDSGEGVSIVSGYHLVNRIQYYITEKPWDDFIEVPISIDKQCDCQEGIDIDLESPVYCNECESGEGYITIYIETQEEMEEIYGPQNV
jgi:hypothetical protein